MMLSSVFETLTPEEAFAIFLQKYHHVQYEEETTHHQRKKTGDLLEKHNRSFITPHDPAGFMSTEEYNRLVEIAGCDPSSYVGESLYTINNESYIPFPNRFEEMMENDDWIYDFVSTGTYSAADDFGDNIYKDYYFRTPEDDNDEYFSSVVEIQRYFRRIDRVRKQFDEMAHSNSK